MKSEVLVPNDYFPLDDEPFMNEIQVEYFRQKLISWKNELVSDSKDTIESLQDSTRAIPDISDRASEETDRALELRTRDRQRKLVAKIDSALRRIATNGANSNATDPLGLPAKAVEILFCLPRIFVLPSVENECDPCLNE